MIGMSKMEKVISTKRGLYGRLNITLPLPIKNSLLDLQKRSGMKKAEFLRVALIMGASNLSEKVLPKDRKEEGGEPA